MSKSFAILIMMLSVYSISIPLLSGIYRIKHLTELQRLIGLSVLLSLGGELIGIFLAKAGINNLYVFHTFTVLQFALLTLIMEKELVPFVSKRTLRGLMVGFTILALFDAFWWNGIENFNNYARTISSILLISLVILFFYKTLQELRIKNLEREPLFWLSIGILIYHSGSSLIFLFSNYVKTSELALLTLWGIHAIFNIFLNISYAIALWIRPAS
ncbi:MAG: hypothetical protein AAF960_29075 [Bacteroidota bacterium]